MARIAARSDRGAPDRRLAAGAPGDALRRIDPLIEEVIVGAVAIAALGAVLALALWLLTGLSPWPFLVLGEIVGLGWGIVLLALASPHHGP